jgi:large subunit ribosomal protein L25
MAQKIELKSDVRDTLGKSVKLLRKQNVTPLHLFGHGLESMALQSDARQVEAVLARAGETRLIDLTVGSEKKSRPVLVREIQRNAINGQLLHVDLYQVRMTEKIEVEVPVVLVGEAPAVKGSGNNLVQEFDTFTVSCLPGNIPNAIEVDISGLAKTGDKIRVKDVPVNPDFTIMNDPDQAVVVITAIRVEVEAPKPVKEAPAEGAAPAEGEAAPPPAAAK